MIKKIIKFLFFRYCFKESNIVDDFVIYYIPGVLKNAPAGQYLFGKINKEMNKIEPFYEITKLYNGTQGIVGISNKDITEDLNYKQ